MRLEWGYSNAVAGFVAQRIKYVGNAGFGPNVSVGVINKHNELVAGVVFHEYRPMVRSIEVSFAADDPSWLTRRLATKILYYPFGQLQCIRITTVTPKKNRRAREFIDRFGFKREGLIRKGFLDDDCVLSGMLASEWERNRFNLNAVRPNLTHDIRAA